METKKINQNTITCLLIILIWRTYESCDNMQLFWGINAMTLICVYVIRVGKVYKYCIIEINPVMSSDYELANQPIKPIRYI